MIKMCYAKMSEPASGDRLTLEAPVSEGGGKIFIGTFDGGIATFSEGITDKSIKYGLQSAKRGGHINLVRDHTVERILYSVKFDTREKGVANIYSPVFCALCEGQILIIECKMTFIRKPLRLDALTFE